MPGFLPYHGDQGQLTSCETNEKNIGTALEMYSTDNKVNLANTSTWTTP
ncbi:MAG: hypothetical protein ACYCW6_23930 [Candidatus Xenobia bacterium]